MNRNTALIAVALAAVTGSASAGTGLSGDITIETTPFVSTKTRAEVRAAYLAEREQVAAANAEDSGSSRMQFAGTRDRAEVVAEYVANRNEVAALHSEAGGAVVPVRGAEGYRQILAQGDR